MAHKTRKNSKNNSNTKKSKHVQHHHFLLRLETEQCPDASQKIMAQQMIQQIVHDVHMKLLGEPRVYYVKYPRYNEGLTALAPIQTSHIAFHFWKNPEKKILHSPKSRCLLEFDLYTCGSLTIHGISKILHHLTKFKPTHANVTLLNRNYSLTLERQMIWDIKDKPWIEWISSIEKT